MELTRASRPGDAAVPDHELAARIDVFAREWARVVARTNFVPEGRTHARTVLAGLLHRLVAALGAEPFDSGTGYDIGRELVAARISMPQALGDSIELLGRRLLDDLRVDTPGARDRLAGLLGQLAAGFTEALRTGALAAAEDIARAERTAWRDQHRKLTEKLQHALLHDQLTGLPNRASLTQRLDELLAGAPDGGRLGLCLINLDRFRAINDSLGADTADHLLVAVAERLRAQTERHGQFLAHLGGDSFAIVVPDTLTSDDVVKVADRVLRALSDSFRLAGHQIPITASAGIVERPARGATAGELVRAADITVGWAKTEPTGRGRGGRWAIFDRRRNTVEVRRHRLTAEMPAALARGEFCLAYQPLVRLADRTPIGVEALARWNHPTLGLISPADFIELAEHTGLIVPLGMSLLEQACTQSREWRNGGAGDPAAPLVSVNLSVPQLRDPGLVAAVTDVLRRTRMPAESLQLEVTESVVVGTDDTTIDALHALADRGIRIAIDDFGTGYSSLAYLADLPVHTLKLAASFVRGISGVAKSSQSNRTILPALISLSHDLDISVTAEGIETAAQARHLTQLGCDIGQGFYLGRPSTADHIGELLG